MSQSLLEGSGVDRRGELQASTRFKKVATIANALVWDFPA